MLLEGELHQPHITNIISPINPYMTDGMAVTSLSTSLQHKTRVTMDCVCQIMLNWKVITYQLWQIVLNQKLSFNLKCCINFWVALKQNHTKRNCRKQDLPVLCNNSLLWFREFKLGITVKWWWTEHHIIDQIFTIFILFPTIQPPIQSVPGEISPRINWPGHKAGHSSLCQGSQWVELYLHLSICLHSVHRDYFTYQVPVLINRINWYYVICIKTFYVTNIIWNLYYSTLNNTSIPSTKYVSWSPSMYYVEYRQYVTVVNPEVDIRSSGKVHKMALFLCQLCGIRTQGNIPNIMIMLSVQRVKELYMLQFHQINTYVDVITCFVISCMFHMLSLDILMENIQSACRNYWIHIAIYCILSTVCFPLCVPQYLMCVLTEPLYRRVLYIICVLSYLLEC